MSFKCGMPIIKTNNGHYSSNSTTHGNLGAVACEAGEERWCSDPDLDRTKTHENIYLTDITSGLEFEALVNAEIDALSEEMKLTSKNHRGLRKDCIRGFAGIVKPDEEIMSQLTEEQQEQFLRDALEVLHGYFGTNPKTNQPNIRFAVIHKDEGNMHLHYQGIPYNSDGRLCADDIFKPRLYKWLNEGFVDEMRQKGWDLEKCVKEPDLDSPYDDVKYKQLRKDAKTAKKELEKAIAGGDETAIATAQAVYDEKHREYDDYKNICVSYKRNKRKEHGKASKAFKEQQETEKAQRYGLKRGLEQGREQGYNDGLEQGFEAVKNACSTVVKDAYREAREEADAIYQEQLQNGLNRLSEAQNRVSDKEAKLDSLISSQTAYLDKIKASVNYLCPDGKDPDVLLFEEFAGRMKRTDKVTGKVTSLLDDFIKFKADKEAEKVRAAEVVAKSIEATKQRIKELEEIADTDGLTTEQQNQLNSLYKQQMMSGATETLQQQQTEPKQQSAYLNKVFAKIEAQRKQLDKSKEKGMDI